MSVRLKNRKPLIRKKWLRGNPAAALAWRSRSRKPIARHVRVRRRNPSRTAREFARCYHSEERKSFVRWMPCIGCGKSPCDNAHIKGGGGSRKADYTDIVPACRSCHNTSHGKQGWSAVLGVTPASVPMVLAMHAAETEAQWQAHHGH